MHWITILWIVIAIVAVFTMARGYGGMMGGVRGGRCGMPRQRPESRDESKSKADESKTGQAA